MMASLTIKKGGRTYQLTIASATGEYKLINEKGEEVLLPSEVFFDLFDGYFKNKNPETI